MTTVAPRTPARAHGELTSVLARVRRRYSYLVWPYGAQTAHVACTTLSAAMEEAVRARMYGVTAVWIVRSDGQEVQLGCTHCGADEEAFRVVSEPTLHAYWCASCCKRLGAQSHTRRLSRLQQDMLRWLGENTTRAPGDTTASHAALVKALDADKGNISKSLRNLAEKHFIDIRYSPGGKAVAIELTPTGRYRAGTLLKKKL
jgi:DNA-binding MarR family transcriptional regulator